MLGWVGFELISYKLPDLVDILEMDVISSLDMEVSKRVKLNLIGVISKLGG
jgi:hypothetical protein